MYIFIYEIFYCYEDMNTFVYWYQIMPLVTITTEYLINKGILVHIVHYIENEHMHATASKSL